MSNLQTAILGGGCFWCLEAVFERVNGVTAVESGYAGGHINNPCYREVCTGATGHAEVVRVQFDADILGYRDLLEVFFAIHDPTTLDRQGNDVGSQYRSVIFYGSEEQRQIAERAIAESAGQFPQPIVTAVEPAPKFFPAEKYHASYFEKNPNQPYCQAIIAPKVKKFLRAFPQKVRA